MGLVFEAHPSSMKGPRIVSENQSSIDTDPWEGLEVEDTPAGPQGVAFPLPGGNVAAPSPAAEADTPADYALQSGESFSSPEERARTRFERLSTAFSTTLLIVGQMYQDEDWKYLTREDGTPYKSLVEVCQDAMGKSAAMARRYVQGAREFYLPLSEVMVEGTRLEITSGDVATLGSEGLRAVVDGAREKLEGVEDPEEATDIINSSLAEARTQRDASSQRPGDGEAYVEDDGDAGWGDEGREYHEAPPSDALGPVYTGVEDDDDPAPAAPVQTNPQQDTSGAFGGGDDLIGHLIAGAPRFDDEEKRKQLPTPVREVVDAMRVLAGADVASIASALTYENRGVILHADEAQRALVRIRAVAETQPWVVARLDGDDA